MEREPASHPLLDVEDAVRRAEEAVEREPPESAIAVLDELKRVLPAQARLWNLAGRVLEDLGSFEMAELNYREAVRLEPRCSEHALDLAEFLIAGERSGEAKLLVEEAIARDRSYARALGLLGAVRAQMGDRDDAEAAFRRALELNPGYAWAGRELSDLLCDCGKIDEAHRLIVDLLNRDPLDPQSHGYLGNILEQKGLAEASVMEYRTALWLKPDYAWVARRLSRILCAQGRPLEAAVVIRAALRALPRDAELLVLLGCTERRMGRSVAAEDCFRRALDMEPGLDSAFSALFDLLLEECRMEEAHALLESMTVGERLTGEGK